MAVSGYQWHAAGVEVVWAPPGGGDVAGPLAAAGCPAAASSLSTERTVKGGSILVRHQAPGPPSRPIVGRRPSPPALTLLISFLDKFANILVL